MRTSVSAVIGIPFAAYSVYRHGAFVLTPVPAAFWSSGSDGADEMLRERPTMWGRKGCHSLFQETLTDLAKRLVVQQGSYEWSGAFEIVPEQGQRSSQTTVFQLGDVRAPRSEMILGRGLDRNDHVLGSSSLEAREAQRSTRALFRATG